MTRPSRRPLAALTLVAAASFAIGCTRAEPAPAGATAIHLIANQHEVTLGAETRPAAAPAARKLLRRDFGSGDEIPDAVYLPAGSPTGESLLVHYRSSRRTGLGPARASSRVASHVVTVAPGPDGPRIPLPGLVEYAGDRPVALHVTAVPAGSARPLTQRAHVAVPTGGRLRVGYGVRPESWVPGAPPAEFGITARDGDRGHALFDAVVDPAEDADRRWFDATIDLSAFAGREIVLDFTTRVRGRNAPLTNPVWSDPVLFADGADPAPNVIVVSLDTLRARSLGTYGYERDTSPFFDATAREGTVFENAITTSVTTAPSHMSLFTGLYPVNHRLTEGLQRKPPEVVTLATRLRDAGYATAAFAENGYLVRHHGFGEGFDAYTDNKGEGQRAPGKVRETFGQARAWLAAQPRRPFFLFVHTYQVHTPHESPEGYADFFADDGHPGPSDSDKRLLRDHYDREIRYVDDELRDFFGTIRERGLEASTIVVLLADHGEEFWEHGWYQHGGAVYEETIRIPLVFWGPGRVAADRRIRGPVSLIDVAPTLLELAGIATPEGLDGRSLVSSIVDGEEPPTRTLFAEARSRRRWATVLGAEYWNPPLVAVRTGNRKFIVHRPETGDAGDTLLFDLASDPTESSPLDISAEDERALDALVSEYLAGRIGAGAPGGEAPTVEVEDPELTERLRQLGYVE